MPRSAERSVKLLSATVAKGVRGVLGGSVSITQALREGFRRGRAAAAERRERALLDDLSSQPASLRPQFQELTPGDLLNHFRTRQSPQFFPGFNLTAEDPETFREAFPDDAEQLIAAARRIVRDQSWPLLGFGVKQFGSPFNWQRDPLSGRVWPLDYHADITLWHNDGSDVRVLWELNRLGHLITLGQAYALTGDEDFAVEFFLQVESWHQQNPLGRGVNWSCAMEVALRALNLLTAFVFFRDSPRLDEERLALLLLMFDQHGTHIERNLEFSYITTSNHYLSDVTGLLWLGILLPELKAAAGWRTWALAEMLGELDKQVLPDGADYESSTGYHRFVLELFLYSFSLCRVNEIAIAEKHWLKLRAMLRYLQGILRPDGAAPLLGDTDGGQLLPLTPRDAADHTYLLQLGAAVFAETQFKPARLKAPPELAWILGHAGLQDYHQLATAPAVSSQAFPDAGAYVLRQDDRYLLFSAGSPQPKRPASHRHNDALSIEVSAGGRPFIVDPGTYVYTADLHERHLFRATAYHSTVQIDGAEQNTIREATPFVIGAEARVRVLSWESTPHHDRVVAEHAGYERLAEPATHRRTVTFHKPQGWWLVVDEIAGAGANEVTARFHFAPGLAVALLENQVIARDELSGGQLVIVSLDLDQPGQLERQFTSRHYGSKEPSVSAVWTTRKQLPLTLRWAIVPVSAGDKPADVLERTQVQNLKSEISN